MKTSTISVHNIEKNSTYNHQTIYTICFKNKFGEKMYTPMECYGEPSDYQCKLFLLSETLGQSEGTYKGYKKAMMESFGEYNQDYVDMYRENNDIAKATIEFFGFNELVKLGKELGW